MERAGIISMPSGVADLLSKAHEPAPEEKVFYFEGDLCQMAKAANVAETLGISTGVAGGIPYVKSKEDFDRVTTYMKIHKVDGYWHYE